MGYSVVDYNGKVAIRFEEYIDWNLPQTVTITMVSDIPVSECKMATHRSVYRLQSKVAPERLYDSPTFFLKGIPSEGIDNQNLCIAGWHKVEERIGIPKPDHVDGYRWEWKYGEWRKEPVND